MSTDTLPTTARAPWPVPTSSAVRHAPQKALVNEAVQKAADGRGVLPLALIPLVRVFSQLYPWLVRGPEHNFHIGQVSGECLENRHEPAVAAISPATPKSGMNDGPRDIRNQAFTLGAGRRKACEGSAQGIQYLFPGVEYLFPDVDI